MVEIKQKTSRYFLEVPVGFRYYLIKGKIKLFIQPELTFAYFTASKNKQEQTYEDGNKIELLSSNKPQSIKNFSLFNSYNIGLEYKVIDGLTLFTSPRFNYSISPSFSTLADGNHRYFSIGLNMGFRLNL